MIALSANSKLKNASEDGSVPRLSEKWYGRRVPARLFAGSLRGVLGCCSTYFSLECSQKTQ